MKCLNVFIIFTVISSAFGVFFQNCDQQIRLGAYEQYVLNSPGYPPYSYMPGSSCRYTFTAPSGYDIMANCYINMPAPGGQCTTEKFYLIDPAYSNTQNPYPYCSQGTISKNSSSNQLLIAYTSESNSLSGMFQCQIQTVPQSCDCGWNLNTRIVGGENAVQNEFPPMAELYYAPGKLTFCGATIISPYFVVSAAHCFYVYDNSQVNVIVGSISLTEPSQYTAEYSIYQIYIKPGYVRGSYTNDIALAQTNQAIVWSKGVGPACLPLLNSYASFANTNVQATGWGTKFFAGPSSNILQKVGLKVLSNSECSAKGVQNLQSSQMCTYASQKDACQYDSGGPIWYNSNRLFLVGVISYGEGCATAKPAINTRITDFLPWIQSITGSLCQRSIS